MEQYICKIATIEEMEQNWNYLIEIHPENNAWRIYKDEAIKNMQNGNVIVYYGIQNGVIISEATAMLDNLDVQDSTGLVDDTTVYLSAFRTRKEFRGKGYFSKLYKFVEDDLRNRGFTKLTIGVEPCEVKNMMIYFKYGFTKFIKSAYEFEPAKNENEEPIKMLVSYYEKDLNMVESNSIIQKGKVIAICGIICGGKTYYANKMKEKENAIILATDEVTYDLIGNEQGEFYDKLCPRVTTYLMKKSVELANIGCNVILDWGFWNKNIRKEVTDYYKARNINIEWHYIDIDNEQWERNIEERNKRVQEGNGDSDFYVTEGLKKKILDKWEMPGREEIDVWYKFDRETFLS